MGASVAEVDFAPMNAFAKYTTVCLVALLVAGCGKDEVKVPAAAMPKAMSEASRPSLSGMSRKQRQAHRILETVGHLEAGLAVLTRLEAQGRLVWTSGTRPDLAGPASALARIREETEAVEADAAKEYHGNGLTQLEPVLTQMLALGNQAVPPDGSAESREWASALISAGDAMETTSPLLEDGLKSKALGGR